MTIKYKIKNREEIPAGLENHYIAREGEWVLDVEGAVEKARLDEFRDNNIALLKQVQELKPGGTAAGAVKPAGPAAPAAAAGEAELEQRVAARVTAERAELEGRLGALAAERDALSGQLLDLQIHQGVMAAASKRGLRPSALADLVLRARQAFRVENGVARVMDPDGKKPRVGKDGVRPMTMEEWVEGLVGEAPHLFETNAGGGAFGHGNGASLVVENPWKRESYNLTRQGQVMKEDPARARQLMAAAGVKG